MKSEDALEEVLSWYGVGTGKVLGKLTNRNPLQKSCQGSFFYRRIFTLFG